MAENDFYAQLYQDVVASADSYGIFRPDAFFDIVTDYLIDAGEFDESLRAYYKPEQGGIRVDGYCGDPRDSSDSTDGKHLTLGLIVVDYNQELEVTTLTNTEMEADFKRLQKFVNRALDARFRQSLEPSSEAFGLADLIHVRWESIDRIKLFLLTNKKLSSRVDGKEADEIGGKEVLYSVWDITRLEKYVASGKEREPLIVDFDELEGGPLRALEASSPNDTNPVFLTAVPGQQLAQIYDRWGARLLEQNVRVFLQARSNVNKGIKRTLENEPELFFSFNNGITATAESADLFGDDDGLHIAKLENLQIVNGGQTTASIYSAYKNKLNLSKVFVQMKLSIIDPAKAKELVPRISQYANSQNKVSAADFFANHPYHVRMEEFSRRVVAPAKDGSFNLTKWFYERARGSYLDAQAYLTKAQKNKFRSEYPKAQTFTKTDLAKYLMVWTENAYFVNRGAQKNFSEFANKVAKSWEENDKQFNETYFKYVIAKKIIFDATGKIVQSRDWYKAGGYRSQHVVLTIAAMANSCQEMKKVVNFLGIWNRQGLTQTFEIALGIAADEAHEILMHPGEGYGNISEWAKQQKCFDALKKKKIVWNQEWLDELIGVDDQREIERESVREQSELNGIEAQTIVVEAGAQFWSDVLNWCVKEGEATDKELGILQVACKIPIKLPTDKQSIVLVQMMKRLRKGGCPYRLKSRRKRAPR